MEISVKERVCQAFKERNFFEFEKKDSLEIFEKSSNLEDVLIKVERNCNTDQLIFHYNPKTDMFCRVTLNEEDKKLIQREIKYDAHTKCMERKCLNKEIDSDSFIKLLEFVFEPIAVYSLI